MKVNEEKSKVAQSRECTYLGYTIGPNGQLRIAPKSKERMRARLKELTARNRGRSLWGEGKMGGAIAGSGKGWYRLSNTPQANKAMRLEWFSEIGYIPLTA